MAKNITGAQIFDGIFSLAKDCVTNKLGPLDQLDYSNGYSVVDFQCIISKDRDLDLHCKMQMMRYELHIKYHHKLDCTPHYTALSTCV